MTEGGMKERFGEIQGAVESLLDMSPGLGGEALAKAVMDELADYGMMDPGLKIDKEEVFNALDIMMEDGQVFFDIENDHRSLFGHHIHTGGSTAVHVDSKFLIECESQRPTHRRVVVDYHDQRCIGPSAPTTGRFIVTKQLIDVIEHVGLLPQAA